jgi:hypothetical protein
MKIHLSLMTGVLLCAGCSSSRFAPEGEFAKDLKSFTRVEPKDLDVESEGSAEEIQRAQAFAGNFRKDLLGRLHSGKILDATKGPAVIIKGRLIKYNWIYTPGSVSLPPDVRGTIEIVFTFWEREGDLHWAGHDLDPRRRHGGRKGDGCRREYDAGFGLRVHPEQSGGWPGEALGLSPSPVTPTDSPPVDADVTVRIFRGSPNCHSPSVRGADRRRKRLT